jgi:hypothetical protein
VKIFFFDDKPIEMDIDHDLAWSWWSAVKRGIAEIKIRVPFRGGAILYDFARIDATRTFHPPTRHDAIPPPPDTLKAPPPSMEGCDDLPPSRQ